MQVKFLVLKSSSLVTEVEQDPGLLGSRPHSHLGVVLLVLLAGLRLMVCRPMAVIAGGRALILLGASGYRAIVGSVHGFFNLCVCC